MILPRFSRRRKAPRDARKRMIRETGLYLTWALRSEHRRIPLRRADQGGYGPLMKRPGTRAAADRFWERMLTPPSSR